jgi:hypothetical protein
MDTGHAGGVIKYSFLAEAISEPRLATHPQTST